MADMPGVTATQRRVTVWRYGNGQGQGRLGQPGDGSAGQVEASQAGEEEVSRLAEMEQMLVKFEHRMAALERDHAELQRSHDELKRMYEDRDTELLQPLFSDVDILKRHGVTADMTRSLSKGHE